MYLFHNRAPFKALGLVVLLYVSLAQAIPWNMARDSEQDSNLARVQYQNEFNARDSEDNSNPAPVEYDVRDSEVSSSLAKVQWQNVFDRPLSKMCVGTEGMYKVSSIYHGGFRDRRWKWECRSVGGDGHKKCSSTGYVNEWDLPMNFMCPANQYLAGVYSIHDNGREDRRWKFTCCGIPNHITLNCRSSGYVNTWNAQLNFQAGEGEVITGVYSCHDNDKK